MTSSGYRLAIFDFDGTLVDSADMLYQTYYLTMQEIGYPLTLTQVKV